MKRAGTIITTALVAAAVLVGFVALRGANPNQSPSNEPALSQPAHKPPSSTPPRLALRPLQEPARQETDNQGRAPSLSALDREAQQINTDIMQERDPEKKAKLERYAKAIEQMRQGLH